MHALRIARQLIRSCCPHIHLARLAVIVAAVAAAVRSRRLTLTELGRAVIGPAYVKHSNTRRNSPVLSVFNLACLIVRRTVDQLLPWALPPDQPIGLPRPRRNAL